MQLKTPTFKNRKLAILWMLFLALALILVDFFLSPASLHSSAWHMQRLDEATFLKQAKQLEKPQPCMIEPEKVIYCLPGQMQIIVRKERFKSTLFWSDINTSRAQTEDKKLLSNLLWPQLWFQQQRGEKTLPVQIFIRNKLASEHLLLKRLNQELAEPDEPATF